MFSFRRSADRRTEPHHEEHLRRCFWKIPQSEHLQHTCSLFSSAGFVLDRSVLLLAAQHISSVCLFFRPSPLQIWGVVSSPPYLYLDLQASETFPDLKETGEELKGSDPPTTAAWTPTPAALRKPSGRCTSWRVEASRSINVGSRGEHANSLLFPTLKSERKFLFLRVLQKVQMDLHHLQFRIWGNVRISWKQKVIMSSDIHWGREGGGVSFKGSDFKSVRNLMSTNINCTWSPVPAPTTPPIPAFPGDSQLWSIKDVLKIPRSRTGPGRAEPGFLCMFVISTMLPPPLTWSEAFSVVGGGGSPWAANLYFWHWKVEYSVLMFGEISFLEVSQCRWTPPCRPSFFRVLLGSAVGSAADAACWTAVGQTSGGDFSTETMRSIKSHPPLTKAPLWTESNGSWTERTGGARAIPVMLLDVWLSKDLVRIYAYFNLITQILIGFHNFALILFHFNLILSEFILILI